MMIDEDGKPLGLSTIGRAKAVHHLNGFETAWGYAQVVTAPPHIYVSGTVSIDREGNPTAVGDMAGQVRNVYATLSACLEAHGSSLGDIIREQLVTTDLDGLLAEGLAVRHAAFAQHMLPGSAPWIEVPRLAHADFLFEAEVMALLPA